MAKAAFLLCLPPGMVLTRVSVAFKMGTSHGGPWFNSVTLCATCAHQMTRATFYCSRTSPQILDHCWTHTRVQMTSAFLFEVLWRNFSIFRPVQGQRSFTNLSSPNGHQARLCVQARGPHKCERSFRTALDKLISSQWGPISGNKAELPHLVSRSHWGAVNCCL